MTLPFEELLKELGRIFRIELHIDRQNACTLQVRADLKIQMQLDLSQENLWIFCQIAETPPGKYRENILREALKVNAQPDPVKGTLAYLDKTNQLVLFHRFPLNILNGERLSSFLGAFLEMAESWKKAIANGRPAPQGEP